MSEVCFLETFCPGQLPMARTGIQGLDEIASGGLPRGRPTSVAGCKPLPRAFGEAIQLAPPGEDP